MLVAWMVPIIKTRRIVGTRGRQCPRCCCTVPGQLGADVGLAPGWHPDHADDVLHAAAAGAVGGDLPLGLGHGHRKVTVCCYWSQWTRCRVTRLWGKWRGVERRAEWSCGVELVWDISHFTIPDSAPGCLLAAPSSA